LIVLRSFGLLDALNLARFVRQLYTA
jgi:hypothetical protein